MAGFKVITEASSDCSAFAPLLLNGPMHPQQCPQISGNTVVCVVTSEHLIEMIQLFLDRQVPHSPHLVLQPRERTPQP